MKIKKEYLIFGGAILLIIILCIIANVSKSSGLGYNKDDIKVNFNGEQADYIANDDADLKDEQIAEQEDNSTELSEVDTEIDTDNAEDNIAETESEEVVDTETTETTETDSTESTEQQDDLLNSDSEIEPHLALDDDSIMTLVQYYVCNLNDDESFSVLLTNELVADRENRLNSEPYSSLNGVTSLKALKKDGNFITITTKDDITYKFECKYTDDGSKISDIVYINE